MADHSHADPGTHSYYDWQVSTLMLAYDVLEPADRDDTDTLNARQQRAEHEVREIAMSVIPESYKQDPEAEFPPELVIGMTRATLRRAGEIARVNVEE